MVRTPRGWARIKACKVGRSWTAWSGRRCIESEGGGWGCMNSAVLRVLGKYNVIDGGRKCSLMYGCIGIASLRKEKGTGQVPK